MFRYACYFLAQYIQGASASGIAINEAFFLQDTKLMLDTRWASKPNGVSDLANARWISTLGSGRGDHVHDQPLARGQAIGAVWAIWEGHNLGA
jgi:hypothetical protein